MKRWVVFVEFLDRPDELGLKMNETIIREIFDRMGRELPPTISYKIRSIAGPYDAKAVGGSR